MVKCAVYHCKNYEGNKNSYEIIKYFTFPTNSLLAIKWKKACGKLPPTFNIRTARICSKHFSENDYRLQDILLNTPLKKKLLNKSAVPSLNIPEQKIENNKEKKYRKRERIRLVQEALHAYEDTYEEQTTVIENEMHLVTELEIESKIKHMAVQTEPDLHCARELEIIYLKNVLKKVSQENAALKQQLNEVTSTEKMLIKVLTKVQIQKLKKPEKRN